jgi:hypothetical protein
MRSQRLRSRRKDMLTARHRRSMRAHTGAAHCSCARAPATSSRLHLRATTRCARAAQMERDILFVVKNNFYIGAYGNAINEASDLEGLTEQEETDKRAFVYRSYIALGSSDVR